MPQTRDPAGYKLVEAGTLLEFEVLSTETKPTASDDGAIVEVELQLDEDLMETCSLGFMFVLGLMSFHHGRPRGVSGTWFEDDDEFTVEDFLDAVRYRRGGLYMHLDYIRGRLLKTTVDIRKDGRCSLQTVHRGEALTRWLGQLQGKKFLFAVE